VTVREIERRQGGAKRWLEDLGDELKAKSYRAAPVRRVMIPKADGKERPLGIPTIKDRVVQTAVWLVLMPKELAARLLYLALSRDDFRRCEAAW
jgi:RNA-directed DNA polymerase